MSKVYSFKRVQEMPVSLSMAWDFFSDPANLQGITPVDMGFKILPGTRKEKMYPGQLIEYIVRPVFNIPVYWMTEITHVQDQEYFVDEQRFGPYSFWHHQHHFRENERGVEMTDLVHYKIPYWFIGDIANSLLVERQLKMIFNYRYEAVAARFPFLKVNK